MPKSPPAKKRNLALNQTKSVLVDTKLLQRWPLPWPAKEGDKEQRGAVFIIAGTEGMPGAAILAATAALRAGGGKLCIATPECIAPWVAVQIPEAMVIALGGHTSGEVTLSGIKKIKPQIQSANAILIGPGMTGGQHLARFVDKACDEAGRAIVVLDAEALECLRLYPKSLRSLRSGSNASRLIITPHAGEMAKLIGITKSKVLSDPQTIARDFARDHGIVTVLKGSRTYIADPLGRLYHNDAGNVGLATSGSGDTLSGIIAGLAARGADAIQAAVWGVALHARAGDELAKSVGPLGYLARELLAQIPVVMAKLSRKKV